MGVGVACLKSAPERADAPFGGVCTEPGGVAPSEIAIATRDDLVAGHSQLDQPFVRNHLPYDEAALLGKAGRVVHHGHHHRPGCVHVLDLPLEPPAAGCGCEVVDYVLSRGGHLIKAWISAGSKNCFVWLEWDEMLVGACIKVWCSNKIDLWVVVG